MGYLNLLSVGMGLIALALPLIVLLTYVLQGNETAPNANNHPDEDRESFISHVSPARSFSFLLQTISLTAMAISILCQLHYNNYLVSIKDWSALLDTSAASANISTILLVVTMILNTITILLTFLKKQKGKTI